MNETSETKTKQDRLAEIERLSQESGIDLLRIGEECGIRLGLAGSIPLYEEQAALNRTELFTTLFAGRMVESAEEESKVS